MEENKFVKKLVTRRIKLKPDDIKSLENSFKDPNEYFNIDVKLSIFFFNLSR